MKQILTFIAILCNYLLGNLQTKKLPPQLLFVLFCCVALGVQAQEVKIKGYTPVGTYQGYPIYEFKSSTILLSSSIGAFDGIYVNDKIVKSGGSYNLPSYNLEISAYFNSDIHKLQLKKSTKDYGICYFVTNYSPIEGLFYKVCDNVAILGGAKYNIEEAEIQSKITQGGIAYPVTSIGILALANQKQLHSITIPESVTSIGNSAFSGCSALSSITIPESVTSIGNSAFSGCNILTSLNFNAINCTSCGSKDYPAFPNSISSLTLGENMTVIPNNFVKNCNKIQNIVLPNSVTTIGNSAFYNCVGITSITLPEALYTIEDLAFYNCFGIKSVVIPTKVTKMGANAFGGCIGLIKSAYPAHLSNPFSNGVGIAYPTDCKIDENGCIYDIDNSIIYYAPQSLSRNYNIPLTITAIEDFAFYNCSELAEVIIHEGVSKIGEDAFKECNNLISLKFNATKCESCGSQNNPAFPPSIKKLSLGDKVTVIPENFLYSGNKIQSIILPNSIIEIGNYAFRNSLNLNSLTIGTGVTSIGNGAFQQDNNRKITKVFWLCTTPPNGYNGVKAYVNYVTNEQYALDNQYVYSFLNSKFEVEGTVYVPNNAVERTCDVVDCSYDESISRITIAEQVANRGIYLSVKNIRQYAFYGNEHIAALEMSNDGIIEERAFFSNSKLKTVTIGNNIKELGKETFSYCSTLSQINIPNSVTALGKSIFRGCSSLTDISLGRQVVNLPENSFCECTSLKQIVIPENIVSIGNNAFYGCSRLSDVTLEDEETNTNVLSLGTNGVNPLFYDCPLDKIYIGRKLSYNMEPENGYSPFYCNTSLRSVEIGDAESEIYDNEFYGCSNLNSIKIGNGVKKIGSRAFYGCTKLDYFSAGYRVESIGEETFSGTAITKFYSYSLLPPACGNQALTNINKWECTLYVPSHSSDEYKAAPQWQEFFFVEEMDAVLVAELRLNATEIELCAGGYYQLTAEGLPANATNKTVSWISSDTNVATVDGNGLVTAVANGTATITAKSADGNAEAFCTLTVKDDAGVGSVLVGNDSEMEVYDLQGRMVGTSLAGLKAGIYIVKQGGITSKVAVN